MADDGREAASRRFRLPPGAKEVLADTGSVFYFAPIARMFAASATHPLILEALHDMPHPVRVLRAVQSALEENGVLVVVGEAVADSFAPNGDEGRAADLRLQRVRLPARQSVLARLGRHRHRDLRAMLERYAHEAGFSAVEVLPVEGFGFFRLSLLRP